MPPATAQALTRLAAPLWARGRALRGEERAPGPVGAHGGMPGRHAAPTGNVTFLFTDIEGSSRLWERCPEVMREALSRHDELLSGVIERRGGYVFKTTGDGFCAAFADPDDAVGAGIEAQRALLRQAWGEATLRVRMGLHTGAAEERSGDYLGPAVNRVARLLTAGHGGQILVSQATRDLLEVQSPESASDLSDAYHVHAQRPTPNAQRPSPIELRDLGVHRLRDLARSEAIYQLVAAGLPEDFPPLRSLQAFAHNLPVQLTSFVGREREMADVRRELTGGRQVTLVGPGGCGKTRLSLQVAADVLDEYADGVWLVELASLSDPELAPKAVAAVLGVREEARRSVTETLVEFLQPRRLLLVLDNCEHVIDACARLADALLRSCPGLKLLATSREALGISGETVWRVLPFPTPDPTRLPRSDEDLLSSLSAYEAVELLVERARLSQPGFTLTAQNARQAAEVCRRLDGIPLALELAAARLRVMSLEQVANRLQDRFRLLTGGSRAAMPRQQTLRAAIDWSFQLLADEERVLLRRLAVFSGGWTLQAAEAVCAGDAIQPREVLDLLCRLVEKSLAVADDTLGSCAEPRYRLLETVREFCLEQLDESGESQRVFDVHRTWYLDLADRARAELEGPDQACWLNRLETEHDNLRAALAAPAQEPGQPECALNLAGALWRFWLVHGHVNEGRERISALLGLPAAQGPTLARAEVLTGAGRLASRQGDYDAARSFHQESLEIRRGRQDTAGVATALNDLGAVAPDYGAARGLHEEALAISRAHRDPAGVAGAMLGLGNVAVRQGEYHLARAHYEESLAIYREVEHPGGVALALGHLGGLALKEGSYSLARDLSNESLALGRALGDQWLAAVSLLRLGLVAAAAGDPVVAGALYQESLDIRRALGDRWGIATALMLLGEIAAECGEFAKARAMFAEGLQVRSGFGDKRGVAASLESFAGLSFAEAQPRRAAVLIGAAAALRDAIRAPLPPNQTAAYRYLAASVREALGESPFAAAYGEGAALGLPDAIRLALME